MDLGQTSAPFENQLVAGTSGQISEQYRAEIVLLDQSRRESAFRRCEAHGFAKQRHVFGRAFSSFFSKGLAIPSRSSSAPIRRIVPMSPYFNVTETSPAGVTRFAFSSLRIHSYF